MGGPGIFSFVVIGGLLSEVIEVAVKSVTPNGPAIAAMFIPGLAPLVLAAQGLITTVKAVLTIYTVATIFINVVPVLQKSGSAAPAAESYNPKGEFKIKDGNLLYIK
jgi:hypothetical protein